MTTMPRTALAVLGAAALIGSVLTNALASAPRPALRDVASSTHRDYVENGNLKITGKLRVMKNQSVYGKFYAHNGAQVWQSLLVRSGGMKILSGGLNTDALTVTGTSPVTFQNASITSALQAGSITATTIASTGAATVGGKLTANGVDAQGGGLSTTGAITASSLTTSGNINTGSGTITTAGLASTGPITATGVTTSGAITANGGLVLKGTVDFSNATVTGLNLGGIGSNFTTLSIGSNAAVNPPLTITSNNRSSTLGVNSSGALLTGPISTSGDLAVGGAGSFTGSLVVSGTSGITASQLVAPTPSGSSQSALTLQGNGINLNGTTSLSASSDLVLGAITSGTGTSASHLVANADVGGLLGVSFASSPTTGGVYQATYTFIRPYTTRPNVTVTPTQDPNLGSTTGVARYWVTVNQGSGTSNYTSFTINYVPAAAVTSSTPTLNFFYHVTG